MNLPRHIVLIPDGNRRWAKKKGKPPFFGHQEGAKSTEKLLKAALDMGIENLTIWGCSVDNITKRSPQEVKFLMKLFEMYFKKAAKRKEFVENKIKVNIFGRWEELFPENTKKAMLAIIEKTKNNDKHNLTFLMAYSGMDEMVLAIRKISELKAKTKKLDVDENLIKKNLWTKNLPPVDLVIRTGGEPHWSSGLMMWDIANSQFYFTETLYPAFSVAEFKKALENYGKTERRMGK
ncbi:MAG: di-trans,poly-cis-decaprenylcistransferase [Candidatus Liptonbacteria bacterium]|nr:di-trans,poly-cis-decaprenylcistransferase [Candidatus Liptonbacteria bacterium]